MHLGGRKLYVIPYQRLFQSGFAQMDVTIIWPHLLTVNYTMLGMACSCSECCVLAQMDVTIIWPHLLTVSYTMLGVACSCSEYCVLSEIEF